MGFFIVCFLFVFFIVVADVLLAFDSIRQPTGRSPESGRQTEHEHDTDIFEDADSGAVTNISDNKLLTDDDYPVLRKDRSIHLFSSFHHDTSVDEYTNPLFSYLPYNIFHHSYMTGSSTSTFTGDMLHNDSLATSPGLMTDSSNNDMNYGSSSSGIEDTLNNNTSIYSDNNDMFENNADLFSDTSASFNSSNDIYGSSPDLFDSGTSFCDSTSDLFDNSFDSFNNNDDLFS